MQSPVLLSETSLQLICNRSHCTKTRNTNTLDNSNNNFTSNSLSKNRFKFNNKLIIQASSSIKKRNILTYHHFHQNLNQFKCNYHYCCCYSKEKDTFFQNISDDSDHLNKLNENYNYNYDNDKINRRHIITNSIIKGEKEFYAEDDINLPNQGQSVVKGSDLRSGVQLQEKRRSPPDNIYLEELIAIQKNGPKNIGFFGTRNMGVTHQNLVEILSYALVLTGNHIFTSGATGTNAAVIRGALRAESPDLLTVVLPQSLSKQPQESQELIRQVKNIVEMPWNDSLLLFDASKLCNQNIINRVAQVICFAFHDSKLMLETCDEAKRLRKIVTLFYLD